jgi:hypothetical protein
MGSPGFKLGHAANVYVCVRACCQARSVLDAQTESVDHVKVAHPKLVLQEHGMYASRISKHLDQFAHTVVSLANRLRMQQLVHCM